MLRRVVPTSAAAAAGKVNASYRHNTPNEIDCKTHVTITFGRNPDSASAGLQLLVAPRFVASKAERLMRCVVCYVM
jgi:hypothetical protein